MAASAAVTVAVAAPGGKRSRLTAAVWGREAPLLEGGSPTPLHGDEHHICWTDTAGASDVARGTGPDGSRRCTARLRDDHPAHGRAPAGPHPSAATSLSTPPRPSLHCKPPPLTAGAPPPALTRTTCQPHPEPVDRTPLAAQLQPQRDEQRRQRPGAGWDGEPSAAGAVCARSPAAPMSQAQGLLPVTTRLTTDINSYAARPGCG